MQGYLIGPNLLGDIRRTIRVVGATPERSSGPNNDGVFQAIPPPRDGGGDGGGIRVCTFIGLWPKNGEKVVTLTYGSGTVTSTALATNLIMDYAQACDGEPKKAIIGRDNNQWFLINAEC